MWWVSVCETRVCGACVTRGCVGIKKSHTPLKVVSMLPPPSPSPLEDVCERKSSVQVGGKRDEAVVRYNTAIKLPRSDTRRAQLLQAAIDLDPSFGYASLSLGADERRRSKLSNAARLLQTAVLLMPSHPPALYSLGETLLAMHRPRDALTHLEAAAAARPQYGPYEFWRGTALLHSNRLEEASFTLLRAASLDPLHAIRTARNDAGLSGSELEASVARSVEYWNGATKGSSVDASVQHHGHTEYADIPLATAYVWRESGGVVYGEPPATHDHNHHLCPVIEIGAGADLEVTLSRAAIMGTPVLLRNVSLATNNVLDSLAHSCTDDNPHGRLYRTAMPVSVLHPNASANRLISRSQVASEMGVHLSDELAFHAIDGILQRPRTEWMSLDALLSLLRSGTCRSRCYAKQVPIDLYLPSLLKSLHPPRFFRDELGGKSVPLTQANLWLGSNTPGQPLLTGLHKDAQPNLVAMIAGRKQVFVVPPSETHLLMPVKLLDVQSSRSVDGTLFPGAPILPTQLDGALVDTQHFMMSVEQLKGQLHPTFTETTFPSPNMRLSPTVCSFRVEAPDALFIPSGHAHAVETSTTATAPDFAAAVNFFYAA